MHIMETSVSFDNRRQGFGSQKGSYSVNGFLVTALCFGSMQNVSNHMNPPFLRRG